MHSSEPDSEVLIAGAGPVGLFLANECARRGLGWRLVEARASQSAHSKALAIFPRTLEIFDMAGLAGPFLEAANRVTWVAVMTRERQLGRIRFAPSESPYSFVAMVPQDVTEKLLAEGLARRGGAVEYETALVGAIEEDGRVRATLERRGERAETSAAFVVGCDGAHSTVRHLLNLPFEGGQYEAAFMLADIETNDALPADEMQLCPSAHGPLAIFPMSATRRRMVAVVEKEEGDAPSLAVVREALKQRGPSGIEAVSVNWSGYFRIHHRQTQRLRAGRMFLAGDAAHIHSPFGGQGMNTGLQDAWNLAWKLELALRGGGSEALLDSYSAERRPVIRQVLRTTDLMTKALGTASKPAQALRNILIPIASRLPVFRHGMVQRLSQLGIAYRGSPLVEGTGGRYWDDSIRGGAGIGSRFLLVAGEEAATTTIEAARRLCQSPGSLVEFRHAGGSGITLVRPDGYVAFERRRSAGVEAIEGARAVLRRHAKPSAR